MIVWSLLSIALFLFLSAVFSGSETGFYSLSPLRVDARASAGSRSSRLIRRLLADDVGLLITILIGNNLMLQLVTFQAETLVGRTGVSPEFLELMVTLVLTPVLFFLGELLPKDLFRRRPHALVGRVVWIIALSRYLFLPLALPLRGLSRLLERSVGLSHAEVTRALGREKVVELLAEGARRGAMEEHARSLAHNVLELRHTRIAEVMVPWKQVKALRLDRPEAELYAQVAQSNHTRLPAVDGAGAAGHYVHQLDVLGELEPGPVVKHLRAILSLPPELSVDRALTRMRGTGQRMALVGKPEAPIGIVTLKDLVEEISGDLGGW